MLGVHYFPLIEHGLQNFQNNYFTIHNPQLHDLNPNINQMNDNYLQQQQNLYMQGTPRLSKPEVQRNFDMFSMGNKQAP